MNSGMSNDFQVKSRGLAPAFFVCVSNDKGTVAPEDLFFQ